MDWQEVKDYLDMLTNSIENDVRPMTLTSGHAPHAVAREVFSYIDHMGSLAAGRVSEHGMSAAAEAYITRFLNSVNQIYGRWGAAMYRMYRHGTVHNFAPQSLTNRTELLSWFEYWGERKFDFIFTDTGEKMVINHGQPFKRVSNTVWWLPVSTICLIDDLKASIPIFANAIRSDSDLFHKVEMHLNFLNQPKSDQSLRLP